MPKRRSNDDEFDPDEAPHFGHFMQGNISELRTKDPKDRTWEKRSHYDGSGKVGFDLTPRKRKRK
jgi:hypothetical protein